MITVRVPKEIRDYKEKLVAGLTVRQLLAAGLALGICVPLYIFGRKVISEDILSWVVILVALPLAAVGFFRKDGLPFEKYMVVLAKHMVLFPGRRKFKTENVFAVWVEKETQNERRAENAKKSKQERRQKPDKLARAMALIQEEDHVNDTL